MHLQMAPKRVEINTMHDDRGDIDPSKIADVIDKTVNDKMWWFWWLDAVNCIASIGALGIAIAAYCVKDAEKSDKIAKIGQIVIACVLMVQGFGALRRVFGGLQE